MKFLVQIGFLLISFIAGSFATNVVPPQAGPPTSNAAKVSNRSDAKHVRSESKVEFNRHIRTILSDNCYACHGPDEAQRQADLRLDNRESAIGDLGGYAAIVPGDPDASELVTRILSDDDGEVMPPADHRKKLTDEQKRLLVQWIREGATWEKHWSLIAPKNRAAEFDQGLDWARNPIDQFVFQKLADKGIKPSPSADKRILIRRLYFDLIGLPPTVEQVDAFINDKTPDAYEKVVKQLLASPHFGERLAIYWLDMVRYADSVGYHGDQDVSVSPYRDYVIDAFNSNMPFDQFTREQLGGDLLDNPTRSQKIASGYNRLGMMSAEGGVQPEEYLVKYAADRVRTTASVWLGMTLGCAECHDHKFDPFSTEDFYRFGSFFADIQERGLYSGANTSGNWGPYVEVPDDELPPLLKPIDAEIEKIEAAMKSASHEIAREQQAWEQDIRSKTIAWTPVRPVHVRSYFQTPHKILKDNSVLFGGKPTDEDAYVVNLKVAAGNITGIRLEALPDRSLPQKGPGRAGNGNFVLTQLIAARGDQRDIEELKKVYNLWPQKLKRLSLPLQNATATIEQQASGGRHPDKKWSAASAIDHDKHGPTWGWAILPDRAKPNELVVQIKDGYVSKQDEFLTLVLHQYHGNGNHVLGRFRISVTSDANPVADPFRSLSKEIRGIVTTDAKDRTAEQNQKLSQYFLSIAPRFKTQRAQIAKLKSERAALVKKHTRTSLITVAVKPREMRVLKRGNWMDKSGKVVSPNTPQSLPPMTKIDSRPNRLHLADWLVDSANPLTARVFVNRLWKLYFGQGIARVLDDLGSQGGWPSHPELLDYLAVEFVESEWDIKKMIYLIVTSSTYRQSSQMRADLADIDPENQLLARQSRFRIDAELIRDNMLATSGLLVRTVGGRSVKPYQPAGLYRHLNFPTRRYQADQGESQFRRGLYTHWQRQFLHPAMKSFDAPAREECTCDRPRSNTPLGALVLLNDPSYVEAARNLAQRAASQTGKDKDSPVVDAKYRIAWMFQQSLSRKPNEKETEVLLRLYQNHRQHFATHPREASELLSIGISKKEEKTIPAADLAALTNVARTIFNLHEFITRY